ncbi:MAG: hypothetical protein COB02_07670 [Candidatus Cloacimonadota bacterium]|nr:MAG: hypothetical protein COB02_07670 [Candidatus Cloacimonadota bacterium]
MKSLFSMLFLLLNFTSFSRNITIDSNISGFNLSSYKVYVFKGTTYQGIYGTFDSSGILNLDVPDGENRYRVDFAGQHYIEPTSSSNIQIDFLHEVTINASQNKDLLFNKRVY